MREKTLLFWFAIAVQAIVRDANGQATRLQPVTGIIAARDLPTPSQQQNRGQFLCTFVFKTRHSSSTRPDAHRICSPTESVVSLFAVNFLI